MRSPKEVILVTGSSGLIGSAVIERLAEEYDLVGFDLHGPPHPPAGADPIEVDLTSENSVRDGLRALRARHGGRLASVIHLAAYYDFSGEPDPKYDEITVQGTARLLRGLQDFEVEQFVFASTMLVHAPTDPGLPIDEDSLLEPKWAYPKSKTDTEQLIRERHGAIPFVLLRIAGVYDDVCHSPPLANQIQRINERWLTSGVYPGDTSHGQAFLHLEDLVEAIRLLIERRAELPRELPLLLGEPVTLSYDELQRTFARLIHGEEWATRQIPKVIAATGAWILDNLPVGGEPFIKPFMVALADDHFELDIGRARSLLGWVPRRSLRETLPTMVAALKADPAGWYQENKLQAPANLTEEAAVPVGGSHEH